jgi:hypothetical protein
MCGRDKFNEVTAERLAQQEIQQQINTGLMMMGENMAADKEAEVGTSNNSCKIEGCEKKAWVDGLCGKHYTEEHGEPYKPQPRKIGMKLKLPDPPGVKVTKQAGPETKPPETETNSVEYVSVDHETIPLIRIFLDPELLDALTKKAKAEYRTIELEATYLVAKGLQG